MLLLSESGELVPVWSFSYRLNLPNGSNGKLFIVLGRDEETGAPSTTLPPDLSNSSGPKSSTCFFFVEEIHTCNNFCSLKEMITLKCSIPAVFFKDFFLLFKSTKRGLFLLPYLFWHLHLIPRYAQPLGASLPTGVVYIAVHRVLISA